MMNHMNQEIPQAKKKTNYLFKVLYIQEKTQEDTRSHKKSQEDRRQTRQTRQER